MSHLIDTTQMYLRTIYELIEEGVTPRRARIAERLHHSGPTVSQTVARMERDGLVVVDGDRLIQLTDDGRAEAVAVMRRHRLVERLLVDVIGLDTALVHDEACRWEHVVSEPTEQRLAVLLDDPATSPFGNPIPSTDDAGQQALRQFRDGNQPLAEVIGDEPVTVTVQRIGEHLQQSDALAGLVKLGVAPGTVVTARRAARGIEFDRDGATVELPGEVADHLFVSVG